MAKEEENQDVQADESEAVAENETAETEDKKENLHEKNIVTVEDSGPCKKRVTIEIPEETIKVSLDEQYQDLRKEAAIPGFRRGRAPLRLVEKRFGSDVGLQVKVKLMADASQAAMDAQKMDVIGDPDIDHEKVELPESGPMRFDFEVEVRPQFELPKLEGIAVEKPVIEVTDEDIDQEILGMRKRAGVWVPKEGGEVEEGDQVVAGIVMAIADVEEHEKLDNVEIFVQDRGFVGGVPVEGLTTLLAGAKVGDRKETSVDVPKTYFNEQYRGKKVDITIEIRDIKRLEPAVLDEEFLRRYGVDSEDELRERLMEMHRAQAEQQARSSMADQVYKHLLEQAKFDLPESIVADQSTRILQRQYTNMLMRGLPREQVEQQMQQLRASSDEQAQEQLKLFFIMDKVAEKLEITASEEEINGHIAQIAAQRNRRPDKVREELAKDGSLAQFALQVREQKCIEKILESAKISDVKPDQKKDKPKKAAKAKAPEKDSAEPADEAAVDDTTETKAARKTAASKRTRKKDVE
ncbi:MAG: trigger factor [Phycisphaerae bacterium]|nr:trigger factor [Phycisphaerae bacterium]